MVRNSGGGGGGASSSGDYLFLSSMELRMGRRGWLDVGERSIMLLKSPRGLRDLGLEGDTV